jgi:hypothetical protein
MDQFLVLDFSQNGRFSMATFAVAVMEILPIMRPRGPFINIENAVNQRERNNESTSFSEDSASMITVVACRGC